MFITKSCWNALTKLAVSANYDKERIYKLECDVENLEEKLAQIITLKDFILKYVDYFMKKLGYERLDKWV